MCRRHPFSELSKLRKEFSSTEADQVQRSLSWAGSDGKKEDDDERKGKKERNRQRERERERESEKERESHMDGI